MNRLPVRPLIKQDESLSGYIMRTANSLDVDPKDLLKHIYNENNFYYPKNINKIKQPFLKIAFSLDVLPFRFLNKVGFCKMLDKYPEDIERMTFTNIFNKLNLSYNTNHRKYVAVLMGRVISDYRRFCPTCLKEEGIYKLLWQVKEIEVCDIHKIKLQHICSKCGSKQKYYSQALAKHICYKCGHFLWNNQQPDELCIERLKYYDDWRFLLDPKTAISKPIDGLDNERALAILCLYVMKNQEKYFPRKNVRFFHERTVADMVRFIEGKDEIRKPTFSTVFKIIRKIEMQLVEFSKIIVPNTYVYSLIKQDLPVKKGGRCLSLWCKYYNSDIMIRPVKDKRYLTNKSVCLGCFMLYGYSREHNCWENVDKHLFDNIVKVKELILLDMRKKDIAAELNIGIEMIDKIIGYLLNYGQLLEFYKNRYLPKTIPNDILEKFKYLTSLGGRGCRKAKSVYGWSYMEYYYYYWLPSVQKQFYFDKEISELRPKRKERPKKYNWKIRVMKGIEYFWVNDIDIGWENLERYFSLNWLSIKQNGLLETVQEAVKLQKYRRILEYNITVKKQVEQYINHCSCEKLTLEKLYKDLNINVRYIKKRGRGLKAYIDKQINQYNQNSIYKLHKEYKLQIKNIIVQRHEMGEKISMEIVSLAIGRGHSYIYMHPELREYFKNVMEEYYN